MLFMASIAIPWSGDQPMDEQGSRPRKKFKTSDLPLSTATKSAIDALVLTTKKKGEFDWLRKTVWGQYGESVCFFHCFQLLGRYKGVFNSCILSNPN